MTANRYIDGIFNYCDRWCERCAFTARCRTYAMEEEFERAERAGIDPHDIDWDAFWKRVGIELDRTPPEWIDEDDDRPEFDLGITFREGDGEDGLDWLVDDEACDRHPLAVRAAQYRTAAYRWLRTHADGWAEPTDTQASDQQRVGVHADGLAVQDAVEIVAWYHTLIAAKLTRAVAGLLENEGMGEPWAAESDISDADRDDLDDEDLLSIMRQASAHDAAGSAKVALISIERSIGAWTAIRNAHPDLAASIAPLQRWLGWMRVTTDRLIPDARTFHRPGFDDE